MVYFTNVCQQKSVKGIWFVVDHPNVRTFTTTMVSVKSGEVIDTRTYKTYRGAMKRYYSLLAEHGHDLYAAIMK